MNRLPTLGLTGLIAVLVVACSSGPSASPSSNLAASQPVSVAPTTAATPSTAPAESGVASESCPPLPNSAPDLLALLPDQVGALPPVPCTTTSQKGEELIGSGDTQQFTDFLDRVGAEAADVSVATKVFGNLLDPTTGVIITAIRVEGGAGTQLLDELKSSLESGSSSVAWESAAIGGKDVQVGSDPSSSGGKTYAYASGDTVFAVIAPDDELAADALSQLP